MTRLSAGIRTGSAAARWRRRAPRAGVVAAATAVALAASMLTAAGSGSAAAPIAGSAAGAACDPEIIFLPADTDTASAGVSEMNDSGLVVGFAGESGVPTHVVVWRGEGPAVDLGIGGVVEPDGTEVSSFPVDVNENGVIALTQTSFSRRGRRLESAALLWDDATGTTTRLPVPRQRPKVEVSALNDRGIVVGSVHGRGKPQVPVFWRDGALERLPLPPGVRRGAALENNNRGLVVGYVIRAGAPQPWWWRIGGRGGALPSPNETGSALASLVDDRGRIVGKHELLFLWRGPTGQAKHILGRTKGAMAMDETGDLAGADGGFRGFGARAWVARLGDDHATQLPDPPDVSGEGWANTFGFAVARGVTSFAPQGGVTVGGYSSSFEDSPDRATLWTCGQTFVR